MAGSRWLVAVRLTSTGQPGERLPDRHELRLPGGWKNGRLIVGLYRSDTLERLAVTEIGEWRLEGPQGATSP